MYKIGHRGAMGHAPENTILSIKRALELDVDMIEIDVQATKDNHLILFHDRKLKRLTQTRGFVKKKTLSQIRGLTIRGVEKIPTLEEALLAVNRRKKLIIELKRRGTAVLLHRFLKNNIKYRGWHAADFLLITAIRSELKILRALNNDFQLGLIIRSNPIKWLKFAIKIKAYSAHVPKKYATLALVRRAQRQGIKIFVYTVNKPAEIEKMKQLHVHGITSDYPERI